MDIKLLAARPGAYATTPALRSGLAREIPQVATQIDPRAVKWTTPAALAA